MESQAKSFHEFLQCIFPLFMFLAFNILQGVSIMQKLPELASNIPYPDV